MKWNGKEYVNNWNGDVEEYNEHPTPEQMLLKLAVEELTPKQRKIWEMAMYEQLTHDEIAKSVGSLRPNITRDIKSIEQKIKKFCKQNKGAYLLLKMEHKIMSEEQK